VPVFDVRGRIPPPLGRKGEVDIGNSHTFASGHFGEDFAPRGDDRRLADGAHVAVRVARADEVGGGEVDRILQGAGHAPGAIRLRGVVPLLAGVGRHPGGGMQQQFRSAFDQSVDVVGEDVVVADRNARPPEGEVDEAGFGARGHRLALAHVEVDFAVAADQVAVGGDNYGGVVEIVGLRVDFGHSGDYVNLVGARDLGEALGGGTGDRFAEVSKGVSGEAGGKQFGQQHQVGVLRGGGGDQVFGFGEVGVDVADCAFELCHGDFGHRLSLFQ